MANDCIPLYEPGQRLTGVATAPIVGKTLVALDPAGGGGKGKLDGANIPVKPAAVTGDPILGVAAWDAALGQTVTIILGGVLPITAGAAVEGGNKVAASAGGKVVPGGAAGTGTFGIALADAANNADCLVLIQKGVM